jgi:tetratricopeptide (TPR) repeat protein
VQLAPKDEVLRISYGDCLVQAGRFAGAAEQFERELEITQDASIRLLVRRKLLLCRLRSGDLDQAEELWRRLLAITPPNQEDWDEYAEFCLYQGRQDEYRATCRTLIEHFGATENAHVAERTGRACLLSPASGEVLEEATALIDRALADQMANPDWSGPYYLFAKGLAEYRHGRLESAISITDGPASPALQPAPRLVSAMARHRLGREEEALRTFAEAIRAGDWEKSRATDREKWIYHILRREAEALMLPWLPAFREGKHRPRTDVERHCLLGACQFEGRYRAAAELYADIISSDTRFADDLNTMCRYRASCSAALAGAGRGQDAGTLDAAGRLRWRNRARDWLRADLAAARKLSSSNAGGLSEFLRTTLNNWLNAPELAGLRDPDACKGLLPSEQKEFQTLCGDLRALSIETRN